MALGVSSLASAILLGGFFAFGGLADFGGDRGVQNGEQVRSRVIVRITPFSASGPRPPTQPRPVLRLRPVEGKGAECLALTDISGIRLQGDGHLFFFTGENRIFRAAFERSCPVRAFYSGFYVEKAADGLLCAGREELHARSGADCTLESFEEMTLVR